MKKIYSIYFSFIFIEQFIIDSLFVSDRYEIANFNYIKLIEFLSYIFDLFHIESFFFHKTFHIWGPYFATLQFLHHNAFIDAGGKSYRN